MIESSVMQKIRQLLKGRPLTNLPKVLNRLKYYGIGRKVTRSIWMRYDEPSYWTVTRVRFKHVSLFILYIIHLRFSILNLD